MFSHTFNIYMYYDIACLAMHVFLPVVDGKCNVESSFQTFFFHFEKYNVGEHKTLNREISIILKHQIVQKTTANAT